MECPNCGSEYKNLGSHWHRSASCEYPELTQKEKEVVIGLLMGDGTVNRSGKSANIKVECIEQRYVQYLSEIFEHHTRDVWMSKTAEESAKQSQASGFVENANPKNYHNVWTFESRQTPEFNQFRSWYSTGKKVFPEDIEMTPTILTHWFAGDGSLKTSGTNFQSIISTTNEFENKEKIESYFDSCPFSVDGWYSNKTTAHMRFNKENTLRLFEYMKGSVPGYEYKWL